LTHVNVIGAGVAGLCVSAELAERGAQVTLYERAKTLGPASCSWWAGGMLAPWCELESAEEPVAEHGQHAASWWQQHAGGVTREGSLVVALARDRNELDRFARRTRNYEWLAATAIGQLEPDLEGRFRRALYFKSEAHLSPRAITARLLERLRASGVDIRLGLEVNAGQLAGPTVDCRGFGARDHLPDLRGVKGEMLLVYCPDIELRRPIRLLHPRIPLYIVPREEPGLYMVGATMLESSERNRITARSMLELLGAAYALHPAFGEAEVVEIGVDARPAFPDNLPRIREIDKVVYANGLYRHGFLLSPSLAQMVAARVFNGDTSGAWHDKAAHTANEARA